MKIKLSKTWKEQIGIIFCFWFLYANLQYLKVEGDTSLIYIILFIVLGIGYSIGQKTYWD